MRTRLNFNGDVCSTHIFRWCGGREECWLGGIQEPRVRYAHIEDSQELTFGYHTASVGSVDGSDDFVNDGVPDGVSDGARLGVDVGWPVGHMLIDGWSEG